MIKHTIILGHGSGDPGAVGVQKRTERAELEKFGKRLSSAIKLYNLPIQVISDHNVLRNGNILKYKGTTVTELHFNAFNGSAIGSEVLIHKILSPDSMDKRIDEFLSRYFKRRGFKKRDNLGNMNKAFTAGINYRLVELCFIDNVGDMSVWDRNVGQIEIGILEAILGKKFIDLNPKTGVSYQVQTGSYAKIENAEKHLADVKKHFPNAFIKVV